MQPAPAQAKDSITLALSRIGDLFCAPAVDPFSARPVDLRGDSGITYLHRRVRLRRLLPSRVRRLRILLPQQEVPATAPAVAELAEQTQAALQRYCRRQLAYNQQARRNEMRMLGRQLLIVFPVTALAFVLLLAVLFGQLTPGQPYLQGVLIIVTLFVGSIALWDVLSGLFFGWAPYSIENHSYRVLGSLEVTIEPDGGEAH